MTPGVTSLLTNRYLVFTGWTLVCVLWATTAVALGLAIFRAWAQGRRPAGEYVVALGALIACSAMGAVMPLVLAWRTAVPASSFRFVGTPGGTPLAVTALNIPWLGSLLQRPVVDGFVAVAALLWAAGTIALGVRFAGGWLLARSIAADAYPTEDPALEAIVTDLVRRGGVMQALEVLESTAIAAPVVIGWRRPRLLVPPAFVLRLPRVQLAGVVAHEIAHIRRGDYAINLLHSALEVPLFFSPAVAWISRCIRDAREFCCDDEAAASIGDRRQYVEALTRLAGVTPMPTIRAAVGIAGPRLITRARRLLQEDSMQQHNRFRLVALGVASVVIVLGGLQLSAASALMLSQKSELPVYKLPDPDVKQPVLVHEVKPEYTDGAKKRQVQGSVELEEVVTPDCTVRDDVRITKSLDPELDAQAVTAAKQWLFKPGTKDGQPVSVRVNIEMTFSLRKHRQ